MKEEVPKLFGHLLLSEAKDKMIKNMTKFQIGTKPGNYSTRTSFLY